MRTPGYRTQPFTCNSKKILKKIGKSPKLHAINTTLIVDSQGMIQQIKAYGSRRTREHVQTCGPNRSKLPTQAHHKGSNKPNDKYVVQSALNLMFAGLRCLAALMACPQKLSLRASWYQSLLRRGKARLASTFSPVPSQGRRSQRSSAPRRLSAAVSQDTGFWHIPDGLRTLKPKGMIQVIPMSQPLDPRGRNPESLQHPQTLVLQAALILECKSSVRLSIASHK